jgi:RimJ/RimL family protein N-acetyltransferase
MRHYRCLPHDPLTDGAFSLTTLQDGHIEPVRNWRNAQLRVLRQKAPISAEQQKNYYDAQIWSTLDAPQPANLLLGFLENGELVGYGGLVHISWDDLRAEVSFLMDPRYVEDAGDYGRFFSGFLSLIKRLGFEDLKLNRLHVETFAFRTAHIETLEKNGFIYEGTMRQHIQIEGQAVDSLIHGCLKHEK